MGEETRIPNKNTDNDKSKDSEQHNPEQTGSLDISDLDMNELDITNEEFETLNNQLDALSSALDDIESKNDNIHAQLLELLQANRVIRQQIRDANLSLGGTEPEEA
ncbi:UPF0184 protein AAEL002161-like [Coccinella septempunctata]|uniref:UPF0184 protein AAEL002161-like n=1 Tax=Coccinella septempunctata TaxID=41139 RepID=UPI001D066FAD|nr:UPF0184 protein AAEL002161-like [Coccinella septempunctata]